METGFVYNYTRSWATLSQGKERIKEHSHAQSHISLVYYLKKPADSGGLTFVNNDPPNQIAPQIFNPRMSRFGILRKADLANTTAANLNPEEGEVVIFPSKTRHRTQPNEGVESRISIAADIVLTVKNSAGLEHLLPDLDRWQAAF